MKRPFPNVAWTLLVRARAWVSAKTWIPPWTPACFRRPVFSYVAAMLAVMMSTGLTAALEHFVTSYRFHGMVGFPLLLCVAILWGLGPAALGSMLNAIMLNYVVEPPDAPATSYTLGHTASDIVAFLLAVVFGLAISYLSSLGEPRRRQLIREHAKRELAEEALRLQSEVHAERLQTIYNTIACSVAVMGPRSELLDANDEWLAITGRDIESVRGQQSTSMLWNVQDTAGRALPDDQRPVAVALRTLQPVRNVLMSMLPPNGKRVWLHVDAVPIMHDGVLRQIVVSGIESRRSRRPRRRSSGARRTTAFWQRTPRT